LPAVALSPDAVTTPRPKALPLPFLPAALTIPLEPPPVAPAAVVTPVARCVVIPAAVGDVAVLLGAGITGAFAEACSA
jgi:hypothetical protein